MQRRFSICHRESVIRTSTDLLEHSLSRLLGLAWHRGTICPVVRCSQVCCLFSEGIPLITVIDTKKDLHIYQGGVALQQLFIFVFVAVSMKFHRTVARETSNSRKSQAFRLLYTLYAVLLLITVSLPSSPKPTIRPWKSANRTSSSELYSALSSTQKASKAPSRTMRCTNTV